MSGAACAKIIICGPPVASAANNLVDIATKASKGEINIKPEAFAEAAALVDKSLKAAREAEKTLAMALYDA